ncbi:MAG: hypothetical protein RLZZ15_899 [Verrucomicrobiota bacterium]|jgi:FkbM family methyltransferase
MRAVPIYPDDYPNWFRCRLTAHPAVRRLALRTKFFLKRSPDRFLARVSQVVHLGANIGTERFVYDAYDLPVIWIEADPATREALALNLAGFPRQRALAGLVTDRDGDELSFRRMGGTGSASSMFERRLHAEMFPRDHEREIVTLRSVTLPTLLVAHGLEVRTGAALVLDIQGAELLALRGARALLAKFAFIKTEAADIEVYAGGCRFPELDAFLRAENFRPISTVALTQHPRGGGLHDVLYQRNPAA